MIFNNMKRILFVTHNQFISIETKLPPLHYCVRVVGSCLYVPGTSLVDDTVQTPTQVPGISLVSILLLLLKRRVIMRHQTQHHKT